MGTLKPKHFCGLMCMFVYATFIDDKIQNCCIAVDGYPFKSMHNVIPLLFVLLILGLEFSIDGIINYAQ